MEHVVWKPGKTMNQVKREVALAALKYCRGNKTHAAKLLGVSIRTYRYWIASIRQETEIAAGPGFKTLM